MQPSSATSSSSVAALFATITEYTYKTLANTDTEKNMPLSIISFIHVFLLIHTLTLNNIAMHITVSHNYTVYIQRIFQRKKNERFFSARSFSIFGVNGRH